MLSFFKKWRTPAAEDTFKTRVENYWQWYGQVAERFYATIEEGKCSALAPEVSEKVDELLSGLAWVFGPGANGNGHSFTLSGEGVLHRQLLAFYAVSRAPSLKGWTFYDSRQPGTIDGVCMEMGGHKFDPKEFWLTPIVDDQSEKLDITVWHPLFGVMKERGERMTPLFLFLDEVLGEFGTEQWIGEITLNDQRLSDAIPLGELRSLIDKIQAEKGWGKFPPGQAATLYRFDQPHERFLRGDVVIGNTMHLGLIDEYLKAEGSLDDPLTGTGADYVFISFDSGFLPQGRQSELRGQIEDDLDAALKSAQSGRLIGGAHGIRNSYIDLLLFDGSNSLEIVKRVLRSRELPTDTSINYFAAEKAKNRIVA